MENDDGLGVVNPFHEGLTILARIISRVYRRNLFLSNLYIPSYGLQGYFGYQNYYEWNLTGEDGISYLVTATVCC